MHTPETTNEEGSIAVEASIYIFVFALIIGLLLVATRISLAGNAIENAASAAARNASLARTADAAHTHANNAVQTALTQENIDCATLDVVVNTSGINKPLGEIGTVSTSITCTVNLSDITIPGTPGTKTLTAKATSPVDAYRERQ